jgi:hypothetical protein
VNLDSTRAEMRPVVVSVLEVLTWRIAEVVEA